MNNGCNFFVNVYVMSMQPKQLENAGHLLIMPSGSSIIIPTYSGSESESVMSTFTWWTLFLFDFLILDLHFMAKWSFLPHFLHFRPITGHLSFVEWFLLHLEHYAFISDCFCFGLALACPLCVLVFTAFTFALPVKFILDVCGLAISYDLVVSNIIGTWS